MKITLLTPALVAILGLALAGAPVTAQAQTSTNAAAASAPAKVATTKTKTKKSAKTPYEGSVTAIDATSVTVATTKKTLTLAIASTTTYLKDGKKATLADFAVGDKVTGSFTTDATGATTACSLHKKTPKAAATPAAPAAPAAK